MVPHRRVSGLRQPRPLNSANSHRDVRIAVLVPVDGCHFQHYPHGPHRADENDEDCADNDVVAAAAADDDNLTHAPARADLLLPCIYLLIAIIIIIVVIIIILLVIIIVLTRSRVQATWQLARLAGACPKLVLTRTTITSIVTTQPAKRAGGKGFIPRRWDAASGVGVRGLGATPQGRHVVGVLGWGRSLEKLHDTYIQIIIVIVSASVSVSVSVSVVIIIISIILIVIIIIIIYHYCYKICLHAYIIN